MLIVVNLFLLVVLVVWMVLTSPIHFLAWALSHAQLWNIKITVWLANLIKDQPENEPANKN